jgi:long-chain fatty acid transport protein
MRSHLATAMTAMLWLALPMSSVALAGGFKVHPGGPPIGEVGAGSAAGDSEAWAAWFNPAAMTLLREDAATVVANVIRLQVHYRDEGSTNALGQPLGGDTDTRIDDFTPVPSLYLVHPIGDCVRVGLAVTAPFGLETNYEDDWVGRYHATNSALVTIDVAPSVAYRVSDTLSVGVGLDVQYVEAELDNAIDFGLIGLQLLGAPGAAAAGLAPGQDDGAVRVHGHDWSIGWNAGVLWQPRCDTRVGVTWRSSIEHELRGEADFEVPGDAAPLLAGGAFQDTDVHATLTMPETLAVGIAHEIDARWTALAGVEWTRWSRFDELRIRFENANQPDSVQPEDWEDVVRVAVGARFRPNERWTLHAGVAFDDSPVPEARRTPRLPDADRLWVGAGVGYRVNRCLAIDVALLHEFIEEATLRQTDVPARGNLVGRVESSVTYFSLAASIDF